MGNKDRGGLVRCIGHGVTPSKYFNTPRQAKTSDVLQLVLEEQKKLTEAHQRDADERRILLLQIKELQEENMKLKAGDNNFKSSLLQSDKGSCTAKKPNLHFSDDKENCSDEQKLYQEECDDIEVIGRRDFANGKVKMTPVLVLN